MKRLKQLSEQLQLDKTLVYGIAARIWQAIFGPITLAFVFFQLSEPERGIYYGLVTVVGIQMFFELGLLTILVSQAGHEVAHLSSGAGRQRMRELIRSSRRWFAVAALLFAVSATGFGWFTLVDKGGALEWRWPLLSMIAASAATVALSPSLAILEGAGFRQDIYRMRFAQMITGNLVVWLALISGLKVWALVLSTCVQFLWAAYVIFILHGSFFSKFLRVAPEAVHSDAHFSWARDVAPMQWRQALISAVYHFATQLFVAIILRFHTEEEAGRLGMTLSVTGAIQSMALAWVFTKFSLASIQHGAGEREAAGTMWRRTAVVSSSLLLLALGCATGVVALLSWARLGLQNPFIDPVQMLILAVGCAANHLIALQSFYVLSRRERPLLLSSLIGFGATGIAVWVGGYYYSINGVVLGYALAMGLVALPLHSYAYLRFRRRPGPFGKSGQASIEHSTPH